MTTPFIWMHNIGVVRVQALKCSASEALNAESYNTLREEIEFDK